MIHQLVGLFRRSIRPICTSRLSGLPVELSKRYDSQDAAQQSDIEDSAGNQDDQLYKYIRLRCAGHEKQVLDSYEKFLQMAAKNLDVQYVRTEEPFRIIKRKTMLANRFVKKKYRVQYEIRNYFRHLLFQNMTGSTADTFLEYVERNLPEGVLLIVEKHRLDALPFELEKQ